MGFSRAARHPEEVSMTTPQAQKKREQRARREAGVTIVQLGVRLEGWAEILVPHGCLAENDMEDRTATVAALELFLEQVRTGNRTIAVILQDRQTVLTEPKERANLQAEAAGSTAGQGTRLGLPNISKALVHPGQKQMTGMSHFPRLIFHQIDFDSIK
jgi:hypothetical protein